MIRCLAFGVFLITATGVARSPIGAANKLPNMPGHQHTVVPSKPAPSEPKSSKPISSKPASPKPASSNGLNADSQPGPSDQQLVAKLDQAMGQQQYPAAWGWLRQLETLRRQQYPSVDYPNGHPLLVDCFQRRARLSLRTNQIDSFLSSSRQALAMHVQLKHDTDGPVHRFRTAELLNDVGAAYHYKRQYRNSLMCYEKAIQLFQKKGVAPARDPKILLARLYGNVGNVHTKLGRYADAAKAYAKSVELRTAIAMRSDGRLEQRELATATLLCGKALVRSSRFAEAIRYLQAAVDLRCRLYPKDKYPHGHDHLAGALRELATADLLIGDTATAKRRLHESLTMMTATSTDRPTHHSRMVRVAILDALLMVAITEGDLKGTRRYRSEIEATLQDVLGRNSAAVPAVALIDYRHNLAVAYQTTGQFDVATRYFKQCLAIWEQYHAANPEVRGEPAVLLVLLHMGNLLRETGHDERAFASYRAARRMAVDLFPTREYPKGHELIVLTTLNLATQCWVIGEAASAKQWYHEALLMSERLWLGRDYPAGQRLLLAAYNAWAGLLMRDNQLDLVDEYQLKAQRIAEDLYSNAQYPDGHFELERCWLSRGDLARRQGKWDLARRQFERVLEMRKIRVGNELPEGDENVASILVSIGRTYHSEGEYELAEQYYVRSLDMLRRLYPPDVYGDGHPRLAQVYQLVGQLCFDVGQYERAFRMACQATGIECKMVTAFSQGSSESQLLNFAARRLQSTGLLLSSWQDSGASVEDVYSVLWGRRGLVTRLIRRRQQRFKGLVDGPDSALLREYDEVRRRLAHSLLIAESDDTDATGGRLTRMRKLNSRKEELERALSAVLATKSESKGLGRTAYTDLLQRLPSDAVMVDFVYYARQIQDADRPGCEGHRTETRICAFLLEKQENPLFVELGSAQEIDSLVDRWAALLECGRSDAVGRQLRDRIWTPVARRFPAATQTVYICPDGRLSRVAWSALPQPDDKHVLLEQFAIAVVPNGTLLAESLQTHPRPVDDSRMVLAVGDVDYGVKKPVSSGDVAGVQRIRWQPLAGTRRELDVLGRLAGMRQVVRLTGKNATIQEVRKRLPEARWAHFATHGLFIDSRFQAALGLAFAEQPSGSAVQTRSRTTVLQRNPFLLSGLALAGANEPLAANAAETPRNDVGILTAEGIISLDCTGLDLVVLSACRTSLGDINLGDSAYGLQNAFHIAGARNVIASLWDVDDDQTTRLMCDFYQLLWQQNHPPLMALRQAQLKMLRRGRLRDQQSRERRPVLTGTVRLDRLDRPQQTERQSSIACWAAFSLSGPGF